MIDNDDLQIISRFFRVYEVRNSGEITILLGEPLADGSIIYGELYSHFARKGKAVGFEHRLGEFALIIGQAKKDAVWINAVLAVATFLSTMFTGALLSGVDIFASPLEVYRGLPFAIAIMLVLGSHELGHYFVSRKYGVDASLPYFIPFPLSPIGTMGAIIRQKGPVPTRKALFDIGIAGPITGLIMSIGVTIVGLMLPAPAIDPSATMAFQVQTPLLFDFLAWIIHPGTSLESVNPIAFAGWVGMLVTVLNMLPVGQLDGGHISRAIFGKLSDVISRIMPLVLLCFGFYGTFVMNQPAEIWIFWGLLASLIGSSAHPRPTDDTQKIGVPRTILAAATFGLTLLCFAPFPISM